MTAPETPTLIGGFEGTLENNAAFEALQGLYNLRIADYSAAFQGADPGSDERESSGRTLRDLIDARDLLNAGRADTLELGQLLLKQVGDPRW